MVLEMPTRSCCTSCGQLRRQDKLGECTRCGLPICGLACCTGDHDCLPMKATVLMFPSEDYGNDPKWSEYWQSSDGLGHRQT
jgi:hypothetical protein